MITDVELRNCEIASSLEGHLEPLLRRLPRFKLDNSLVRHHPSKIPQQVQWNKVLPRILRKNSSIESLDISVDVNPSEEEIGALVEAIVARPGRLVHLALGPSSTLDIDDANLCRLYAAVGNMAELKSLELLMCGYKDRCVTEALEMVLLCESLESLGFNMFTRTNPPARSSREAMMALNCNITHAEFQLFTKHLPVSKVRAIESNVALRTALFRAPALLRFKGRAGEGEVVKVGVFRDPKKGGGLCLRVYNDLGTLSVDAALTQGSFLAPSIVQITEVDETTIHLAVTMTRRSDRDDQNGDGIASAAGNTTLAKKMNDLGNDRSGRTQHFRLNFSLPDALVHLGRNPLHPFRFPITLPLNPKLESMSQSRAGHFTYYFAIAPHEKRIRALLASLDHDQEVMATSYLAGRIIANLLL